MSPEHFRPSDTDSTADRGDRAEAVPKAVEEAQMEIDRLLTSLGDDGSLPSEGCLSETDENERTAFRPGASIYLMISSKEALTKRYGHSGFQQLDGDLRELQKAVRAGSDLEPVRAYVDDERSLSRFGLRPADPTNPWQVKRIVDGVEGWAAEHGGQVGYVLIIGDDGVIPFHRLPNPVDDQDSDVPSDNPYACRDGGYLIPERAVGRLPDGGREDTAYLERLIWTAVEAHEQRAVPKGLFDTLGAALSHVRGPGSWGNGLGYSASIWRKASRAVFHIIGDDSRLRTSPPLTYQGFHVADPPHFSYFNLHGVEDGPNWYGQRDALFPAGYSLFPLALRPQDPSIEEHRRAVVFTEACYGANILGKSVSDSIALRLLGEGALGVVGSTKVSYGSIAPPLLGADLLGRHFWKGLQAGLTIGEAMRHAKVSMAKEMQERQGYLDDEDQKALVSFALYGDPALSIPLRPRGTSPRTVTDFLLCPPIICSKRRGGREQPVSEELIGRVKARVEASLPHMSHARMRAKRLSVCSDVASDPCSLVGEKAEPVFPRAATGKELSREGVTWSMTLQKDISISGEGSHCQVVRVVVDENGRIRRLAMSK